MSAYREIDEFLRDLHEAAQVLESVAFRSWVLSRIRERVPFECGCWTVGVGTAGTMPHDVVVVGAAPRAVEDARLCWYRDRQVADRPAAALRFQRTVEAPAFDDEERQLLALLASQACGAWLAAERTLLLRHMSRPGCSAALVDREGCVRAVSGAFYEALRASWPEWRESRVPAALRATSPEGNVSVRRGLRWTVESVDGLLLVVGERIGAAAVLTDRERTVATAVLEAGSQRAAAQRLRISGNTVRNTLARVYAKLGVRDRVELALRLRPELAPQTSSHD
jgi:DNA-binding CsgD family transcriptional regulator